MTKIAANIVVIRIRHCFGLRTQDDEIIARIPRPLAEAICE
jgi:hypothetical protein